MTPSAESSDLSGAMGVTELHPWESSRPPMNYWEVPGHVSWTSWRWSCHNGLIFMAGTGNRRLCMWRLLALF
eukprot:UN2837